MLRVDLGQLSREGSAVVEARLPAEGGIWEDTDLRWAEDVQIKLRVSLAGTGEVVARGKLQGTLRQECRRCLSEVDTDFSQDLTIVFVADGADADEESGAYAFESTGLQLELGDAVREEVVLAVNPYVVCDPDCRGLCPKCGANLNEGPCGCTDDETDPRWAALRDLKSE
jgi:uncharacterized protein